MPIPQMLPQRPEAVVSLPYGHPVSTGWKPRTVCVLSTDSTAHLRVTLALPCPHPCPVRHDTEGSLSLGGGGSAQGCGCPQGSGPCALLTSVSGGGKV